MEHVQWSQLWQFREYPTPRTPPTLYVLARVLFHLSLIDETALCNEIYMYERNDVVLCAGQFWGDYAIVCLRRDTSWHVRLGTTYPGPAFCMLCGCGAYVVVNMYRASPVGVVNVQCMIFVFLCVMYCTYILYVFYVLHVCICCIVQCAVRMYLYVCMCCLCCMCCTMSNCPC